MSELTYEHTDGDGDKLYVHPRYIRVTGRSVVSVEMPFEDVPQIVEALAGRKIAAIVYEDELPEVQLPGIEGESITVGGGPEFCAAKPHDNPQWLRNHAAGAIALARHIEAHAAAAKEQERAEEEAVEALARRMHAEFAVARVIAGGRDSRWGDLQEADVAAWHAAARAARAPQATTDGGES